MVEMKKIKYSILIFVVGAMIGCDAEMVEKEFSAKPTNVQQSVEKGDSEKEESFFIVDDYDPSRDASNDLKMAVELASKSNKNILIEVGGKW